MIRRFIRAENAEHQLGDFEEAYQSIEENRGTGAARRWYWRQVFRSMFPMMKSGSMHRTAMARNYLMIAWRNIRKQKVFTVINLAGLALGMAICILLLLWIQNELSYDRFHKNGDQIYRINTTFKSLDGMNRLAGSPAPLGPALLDQFPQVANFTRIQSGWTGWYLHIGDKVFMEERLAAIDPGFFQIFQFPFIQGDPATALNGRHSIVLTETLARKIFGNEDPMGQVVQIGDTDMEVTGVVWDIPKNSTIQFDYAFPMVNMTQWRESKIDSWDYLQFATYIELKEGVDVRSFAKEMNKLTQTRLPENLKSVDFHLDLQPLKDAHLHSTSLNTWMLVYPNPGNIRDVRIFSAIALCILLLACINFMNLSSARAVIRAREVGLRKVIGARRMDLIKQFFSETVILALLSFSLALLLVTLAIPTLNSLTGKALSTRNLGGTDMILSLLAIVVLTGLLSGGYPAVLLSSFRPAAIFRGSGKLTLKGGGHLRKGLIVLQFSFTVLLILGTATIFNQLRFIRNKDLGYSPENIVSFAGYGKYYNDYEGCREALLQHPDILHVSTGFPPGHSMQGSTDIQWEGMEAGTELTIHRERVYYNYEKVFGMRMALGRFFSTEFATDSTNFVLNETAVFRMGLKEPVGKRITYQGMKGEIVGVVRDYHGGSLHFAIQPKIMALGRGFFMFVRFRPGTHASVMEFLENKWKEYVSSRPFRYEFIDQSVQSRYVAEGRMYRIIQYFTIVAVIIACLGLFGLAAFLTQRRVKEIGIRKVLGASVPGLLGLLSLEFLKWVVVANAIAWPAAWWVMRKWLDNFVYRADMTIGLFILCGTISIGLALLTVGYQTFRTAHTNPVDTLRYE
jgi:ABC-type antimicrobial peptide transport system permease subunit